MPVALLAVIAATAAAAPSIPKLVTTNPESSQSAPATSLTPAILGEAEPGDEVILEAFPFEAPWGSGPVTRTAKHPSLHPNYEIQIFIGSLCQGTPVAVGTAEELEEEGIPVAAAANSATPFSSIQIDEADVESSCSNSVTYWEGNVPATGPGPGGESTGGGEATGGETTGSAGGASGSSSGGSSSSGAVAGATPAGPKPEAPKLHLVPGERANDLTPLVAGSAAGADSVTVYAGANCNGSPVAKGAPSQLADGFEVSVARNSTTTFSAVAIAAQHSGCSDPVTYTEDSTAPRTRITMGPGVKTRKRKAVFRFTDVTEDPPGTTFVCKLDKKKWKPCSSPFHVKHLNPGHYLVSIRATDVAGNIEPKPVKRRFTVVGTKTP
jgi:hypothetical protein